MITKICGIKTTEHALVAAQAGADFIGVMFAQSRRQVSVEQAQAIREALNTLADRPKLVGLFVNTAAEAIATIAEQTGIEYIQLSGDESVEMLNTLPELPILKSIRMNGSAHEQAWIEIAQSTNRVLLLVDAHVAGSYGGTGALANWAHAAQLARQAPILLAGGLNSRNIADAIHTVQPLGVDVSTGVETDGVKDSAKIQAFIAAAQAAAIA